MSSRLIGECAASDLKRDVSKCLVLFCGLPGSGKTTLIHTLCDLWDEHFPELSIKGYSIDDLVQQNKEGFDRDTWKAAREDARSSVQESLSVETGQCLVYIDDTMFYRSMRHEFFHIAVCNSAAFHMVHVHCPLSLCLERNMTRGLKAIPDSIIRKTAEQFEPPDETKAYWEKNTTIIDSKEIDIRDINACRSLALSLMNGWRIAEKRGISKDERIELKQRGQKQNQASSIHQLDLHMRVIISNKVKHLKADNLQNSLIQRTALSLNRLRIESLNSLRCRVKLKNGFDEEKGKQILDYFIHSVDSVLQQQQQQQQR